MSSNLKKIGIIGAMESEVKHLIAAMQDAEKKSFSGSDFYSGTINGCPMVVVRSGIGKVNAARITQVMIDRFGVDAVINSGIAGGVSAGLHVGDVVVGMSMIQHDFDISVFGHARGYLATGHDDDKPTVFHSDEKLVEDLEKAAAAAAPGRNIVRGTIASGDQFISEAAQKKAIHDEFGADAAEMEGAAIAQTAYYSGVPFVVLRVISDLADGTAAEVYDEFELEAARMSSEVMKEFASIQAVK